MSVSACSTGSARSADAEALAMTRAHRPDIAILDLRMPDREGISQLSPAGVTLPDSASGHHVTA